MALAQKAQVELRRPGLLEQTSTHRHHLGFYTAVCCAAQYHAPRDNVKLSLNRLFAALRIIIGRHAPLAVGIQNESSRDAVFTRVPEIDLQRMVQLTQLKPGADRLDALNAAIEAGLSARFERPNELPLWRLFVLVPDRSDSDQDTDVVLFIHHGVADGTTAVIFHRELQKALNDLGDDEPASSDPVVIPPALDFLPSLEVLHPLPVSYFVLARALWQSFFPSSKKGLWTGTPTTHKKGTCVQTRHAIHIVEGPALAGLLAACKKRGMTLQPLLEALFARAMFTALPELGVAEKHATKLTAACPINLRPYMTGDWAQTMGVLVASDTHKFKRSSDVWTDAARTKTSLAATLKKLNTHVNTGMLRFAGDIRSYLERGVGKPRSDSFEVSNAGSVNGGLNNGWSFGRVLFTQSGNVTGAAVHFNVCSVKGGCMYLGASWQEGVIDEKLAAKVFENLDELIQNLISS